MVKLYEEIENRLKNENKRVVMIAGASASGKSYMAENFKKYMEGKGKKVLQFSSDMYYKGIARIITEKTFLHNVEFMSYVNQTDTIAKHVRDIIEFTEFKDKFYEPNFERIKSMLQTVMPPFVGLKFADKLKGEFERINFDEPFCIDFNHLSKDITTLINGGTIYLPSYSFRTGESTIDTKNGVKGSDYDIIVVEGLYTLRPELLNKINANMAVTVGIDCDNKTLLARRFNRDINEARAGSTPGQTIMAFLTQVMPSFYTYIYPTLSKAELIYNATLTKKEVLNKEQVIQIKYEADSNIIKLLRQNGASNIKSVRQRDYFLEDKNNKNVGITLRIREEGGLATKLTLKVKTSKLERSLQEYDLVSILKPEDRNIQKLLTQFSKSGYVTTQVIDKTRKVSVLNGTVLKIDLVKDLGNFVEIDGSKLNQLEQIKTMLNLSNPSTKSYLEMYLDNINNLRHTECEMKYVVKNLPETSLSQIFRGYNIKQYYLSLNNPNTISFLGQTLNGAFNMDEISQARIRIVDDSEAYLTLKSDGTKERVEIEKEVPVVLAYDMVKGATSVVEKTRYELTESEGKKVELDFYHNRPLCVLEIEYDDAKYTDDEINEFAGNIFGKGIELENVTDDSSYKNINLAVDLLGDVDAD